MKMRNVFPCESYPYDWKVNYELWITGILSNMTDDNKERGIYETNVLRHFKIHLFYL